MPIVIATIPIEPGGRANSPHFTLHQPRRLGNLDLAILGYYLLTVGYISFITGIHHGNVTVSYEINALYDATAYYLHVLIYRQPTLLINNYH